MGDNRSSKQVIVVEDDANDYTLIDHALRESGIPCRVRRVDTAEELDEELTRLAPDLVVCDHAGATWDSFSVLDRVRAFQANTPFVVVSGALNERLQAELMARGADGCVTKTELQRLASVVQRALEMHAEDQRKRVEEIRRSLPPLPVNWRRRMRLNLSACAG
jgi:two-component system sensor histidine kinase UhpB